jgi:hypothetical protein
MTVLISGIVKKIQHSMTEASVDRACPNKSLRGFVTLRRNKYGELGIITI